MDVRWVPYAAVFLSALVASLAMTPLAGHIAWKVNAVDYPGIRRINKQPIPRMGGIAVFAAIVVAFLVQYVGTTYLGWETVLSPSVHLAGISYQVLASAFGIIFLTGILDDKFHLKPLQKLAGQLLAAIIAVSGGLMIGSVVNPFSGSYFYLGWAAYPVTVFYLVAYVNIFNLIDGLDGLASGIACIAGFTMFTLAMFAGRPDAATLAISLVGATLGFLRYNFHPASIFLGDSGSLLLGFTLGTVSLLSVTRIAGFTTVIVPLVIAGMPIIDTFSAIIRRFRAGVSIGQADRGHIQHRLLNRGFDQRRAVLTMYAWTGLLCIGTLIMTQVSVGPRVAVFGVLVVGSAAFAMHLRLFEPVLLHHYNKNTGEDELVDPDNPAFEDEKERFVKEHHLERLDIRRRSK
ncbi:glycosyltransferase family 4 protein [Olegusella massiliensis]|uniref:glycosyltransferase family 4 protein n=1 Tax=Olegusella massiliensis TaxID=1776381 RepID=UPI000839A955|nr:MraY family glycosyltransferase [Olegusella massiliensis]